MMENEKRPSGTNTGPLNGQRGSGAIASRTGEIVPPRYSNVKKCNVISPKFLEIEYQRISQWLDELDRAGDDSAWVDAFVDELIPAFGRLFGEGAADV